MDDLLSEFLAECREGVTTVEAELVSLGGRPEDRGRIAAIFRVIHTIKGTCGFLSLARLGRVAHALEDVLGRLRAGELSAAAPGVVDAILAAVDRVRHVIDALASGRAEPEGNDDDVIALLAAAGEGGRSAPLPRTIETGSGAASTRGQRAGSDLPEWLAGPAVGPVLARARRLDRITAEPHDDTVRTRTRPIGGVWDKLARIVRDLGAELGKTIDLRLEGGDTELDRGALELIRVSLTHMVRNAADHGVEPPEERRSLGKPEAGLIRLEAFPRGDHVVIRISDDGRGLDAARIGAKAVASGLVTGRELARMTADQIRRLIFAPGFSTAETISGVSGRGVGMDVVRANVERLGGSIDLASEPGRGSTFTIGIPLTPAPAGDARGRASARAAPASRNSHGPPPVPITVSGRAKACRVLNGKIEQ